MKEYKMLIEYYHEYKVGLNDGFSGIAVWHILSVIKTCSNCQRQKNFIKQKQKKHSNNNEHFLCQI